MLCKKTGVNVEQCPECRAEADAAAKLTANQVTPARNEVTGDHVQGDPMSEENPDAFVPNTGDEEC